MTGKVATQLKRCLPLWGAVCVVLICAIFGSASVSAQGVPYAAVVMDARSGQILHARNHDTRLHPASLTKMMTLYVAFEAISQGEISLDTRVRISQTAAAEPPSRLGLRAGQTIQMRYLIRAAALRSANDASTAIAEAISGSVPNFTARMNRTAAAIGMSNTTFRNAHGLTAQGHLSTARDMTILGRQLYFDYPQYYNLFSRRSEDAGIAHVNNTNRRFLDAYQGADGIKTGFTNAAGYNLTASAQRNGVHIIVTVFGGRSGADRHQRIVQLMDRGFAEAPRRAAVRRPARPNYSAPPRAVASVAETPETGDSSGTSGGRVIRLQTAVARSPFPQRRPSPDAPTPAPELLASLQTEITAVLAEVAAPAPTTSPVPDPAPERPAELAPARSLAPAARPETSAETEVTRALTAPLADLDAARLAGFSVIGREEFDALTADDDPDLPEISPPALAQADMPDAHEQAAIQDEDPDLPFDLAEATTDLADPDALDLDTQDMTAIWDRLDQVDPTFHSDEELAEALAEAARTGVLDLPMLPALSFADPGDDLPPLDWGIDSDMAVVSDLAPLSDVAVVQPDGQILWRDETLLTALLTDPALGQPEPMILLTTVDSTSAPALEPMPEIITRVSTEGGRVFAINLGPYPSRFDAERIMMQAVISENTTLAGGIRQVVQRSGRHEATIQHLTQDQAEVACLRLSARGQGCAVVTP